MTRPVRIPHQPDTRARDLLVRLEARAEEAEALAATYLRRAHGRNGGILKASARHHAEVAADYRLAIGIITAGAA